MTSRNTPTPKRDLEVNEEGSTIDRFLDLTGKLLSVSHDEIMAREKIYKEEKKEKKK